MDIDIITRDEFEEDQIPFEDQQGDLQKCSVKWRRTPPRSEAPLHPLCLPPGVTNLPPLTMQFSQSPLPGAGVTKLGLNKDKLASKEA